MLITEQRAVTRSIQAPSGLGIESRGDSSQTPRIQLQQESRVVVHPYIHGYISHLRRTHTIHLIPILSIDLITSWETIAQLFLTSSSSSIQLFHSFLLLLIIFHYFLFSSSLNFTELILYSLIFNFSRINLAFSMPSLYISVFFIVCSSYICIYI